jgi:hypothetical protein
MNQTNEYDYRQARLIELAKAAKETGLTFEEFCDALAMERIPRSDSEEYERERGPKATP